MLNFQDSMDYNKPKKQKSSKWLYIVGTIVLMAVVVGVTVFAYFKFVNKEVNNEKSTNSDGAQLEKTTPEELIEALEKGDRLSVLKLTKYTTNEQEASDLIDETNRVIDLKSCKPKKVGVAENVVGYDYRQQSFACKTGLKENRYINGPVVLTITYRVGSEADGEPDKVYNLENHQSDTEPQTAKTLQGINQW